MVVLTAYLTGRDTFAHAPAEAGINWVIGLFSVRQRLLRPDTIEWNPVKTFDALFFQRHINYQIVNWFGELKMKILLGVLPALIVASALTVVAKPSLACEPGVTGKCGDAPGQNKGAPAPLLGAGIPGLAIGIGYGAYLIARRRRSVP
ncbi:hypothetical protein [Bradyrhizobium sp. McL0616]|uniref:hypothetical protein n=1 Tax=Bradyrhizobium sp. McL0616 TaxID=3415674 RepID=UPI003CED902C